MKTRKNTETMMLELVNNGISLAFFGQFDGLLLNARAIHDWYGAEWLITWRGVVIAQSKETNHENS